MAKCNVISVSSGFVSVNVSVFCSILCCILYKELLNWITLQIFHLQHFYYKVSPPKSKKCSYTFYLHSICLFWMHSQQIHLWHLNLSTGIKEVCSFSVSCTRIPADWLHTFGIPQDFRSFPGHPGPLSQEHFHSSQEWLFTHTGDVAVHVWWC